MAQSLRKRSRRRKANRSVPLRPKGGLESAVKTAVKSSNEIIMSCFAAVMRLVKILNRGAAEMKEAPFVTLQRCQLAMLTSSSDIHALPRNQRAPSGFGSENRTKRQSWSQACW